MVELMGGFEAVKGRVMPQEGNMGGKRGGWQVQVVAPVSVYQCAKFLPADAGQRSPYMRVSGGRAVDKGGARTIR